MAMIVNCDRIMDDDDDDDHTWPRCRDRSIIVSSFHRFVVSSRGRLCLTRRSSSAHFFDRGIGRGLVVIRSYFGAVGRVATLASLRHAPACVWPSCHACATGNGHQVRGHEILTTGMYFICLLYLIDGRIETAYRERMADGDDPTRRGCSTKTPETTKRQARL